MRNLLVINPNTSATMTKLLLTHIQAAVGQETRVHAVTAAFGAPYIADEVSYSVAGHATLAAYADWSGIAIPALGQRPSTAAAATAKADAIILGCFGDPGLFALREVSGVPVVGLADASFELASRRGRFAVVTGGMRWRPMLERLASATGHRSALAGIRTIVPTGAELAANPAWARSMLTAACREAAREFGADSIVLGGAGLAGMAAALQPDVDVPVIDSVLAGAEAALAAM